jgi:SAM-dependent methyltransferase
MNPSEHIPLYRDGRHYDALNSFLVADIPFYVDEARRVGGPVLELACGTGRLTNPIAQAGVEIVGLDISPSMLSHARAKARAAGVKIEFVEGDCRSFELGRKFALIFMAFNSMQHMHDHASLAALFASVRKHLGEGGRFIVDVFNPRMGFLARMPEERWPEREYEDPDGNGTIVLEHSMRYDDAVQVSHITWYFSRRTANGFEPDFREEKLDLRCFFPQELDLLVRSQGFEIVEKLGGFDRKPFESGKPKQVMICRQKQILRYARNDKGEEHVRATREEKDYD